MGEFRKVQDLYPNSVWVDEARAEIGVLEDHLSADALIKARFYYKRKSFAASDARLRDILRANPDWDRRDEVLYLLGMSLHIRGRVDEGEGVLLKLQADFPESAYSSKARKVLGRSKPASEEPAGDATG
jgi:outer membrane protein assembly factor BamD